MINNLADAMVVIREQAQEIERLRVLERNSDYAKCKGCIYNISTNKDHIICARH